MIEKIKSIRSHDYYVPFMAVFFFALVLTFLGVNLKYFPEGEPIVKPLVKNTASIIVSIKEISDKNLSL